MQRVWLKQLATSTKTKVRLYNSCVRSRLLYNAGVSAYTRVQLDKFDAAHSRQLRTLLGIYYPERISNLELYELAESRPISVAITELRWTMLGHTLRPPEDTPGNKAIKQYFPWTNRQTKKIYISWESADNNTKTTTSGHYKETKCETKEPALRDRRAQQWYRPSETKT